MDSTKRSYILKGYGLRKKLRLKYLTNPLVTFSISLNLAVLNDTCGSE